jgi:hypothetical protein
MSFRIVWRPEPFDNMAHIIRQHPDYKELFAEALRSLSATLSSDPNGVGESRPGDARIEFFYPLGVTYRVFEADQEVHIIDVYLTRLLL